MDYHQLDSMIDHLKSLLPRDQSSPFDFSVTRSNWKEFWNYASTVQQGFNSKVRYPTGHLRQEALDRFNNLRNEASRRGDAEREARKHEKQRSHSEYIARAERNIEKNKERLRKAINALERQQERAHEIRSKIRERNSTMVAIIRQRLCQCGF